MADSCVDSCCIEFATMLKNEIFFKVKDPDYEDDTFISSKECLTSMIQNKSQRFLVVEEDEDEEGNERPLNFHHLTVNERRKENSMFRIKKFKNTHLSSPFGLPVTLQVDFDKVTWTVCCREDGEAKVICARVQDPPLPEVIESTKHEALFFLKAIECQPHWYKVASSMWPNLLLSFEGEPPNPVKLVLKEAAFEEMQSFHLRDRCFQ